MCIDALSDLVIRVLDSADCRRMLVRCVGVLLPFVTAASLQAAERPNILVIVCDDLNTHVQPSGYPSIQTPTLSALAAESMAFNRTYCQYPVCGPSRASFLSGLYPESIGITDNTSDLREQRPGTITLPQFLRQHGYWTASTGKVFHSPRQEPGAEVWDESVRFENDELPALKHARERFEAEFGSIELASNRRRWRDFPKPEFDALNAQTPPGHGRSGLTDAQHKDGKNVRQVASWLEQRAFGEKPFFIACGIQKPHVPFLAPDRYFDLYPVAEIPFAADRPDLWKSLPESAVSRRFEAFGFELGREDPPLRREYMQAYHACISFLDAQLAIMLQALRESGHWNDTVIIFMSDHGYHLGDHFLWGKVTLFDIGTRVPFLVRAPGITTPGSRSEAMVELVDVFPTLADLAGLTGPADLQGVSLRPLLERPELAGRKEYAYTVVRRGQKLGRAVRSQRWRYASWPDGEELYDLQLDPEEKRNLAGMPEMGSRLQELRTVLLSRQELAESGLPAEE